MKIIKRAWRKVTFFFRVWNHIRFLDKRCMSIRLSNASGQFIGHWNCDGDFIATVEEARKRINYQTTKPKPHE